MAFPGYRTAESRQEISVRDQLDSEEPVPITAEQEASITKLIDALEELDEVVYKLRGGGIISIFRAGGGYAPHRGG